MATDWVDDPGADEHIAQLKADLLDRLSNDVLDDVIRGCPVSADGSNGNPPGWLRDHQRRAIEGDTARIGSDVYYSPFVEDGHRVAYRQSAGVTVGDTRFVTYGDVIYTGEVVPPQPFLRTALYRRRTL